MTEQSRFTVLVSRDRGYTWKTHAGIIAGSADAAIKRVLDAEPELKTDEDARFYASSAFRPRRLEKELVERWSLQSVEPPEPAEKGNPDV
jgi:hypothetical protein